MRISGKVFIYVCIFQYVTHGHPNNKQEALQQDSKLEQIRRLLHDRNAGGDLLEDIGSDGHHCKPAVLDLCSLHCVLVASNLIQIQRIKAKVARNISCEIEIKRI